MKTAKRELLFPNKEMDEMGLFITFLLGLFFLVGVLVVSFHKNEKFVENLSISIAFGTMVSLIVFDLVPEMLEHMEGTPVLMILLFVIFGIALLKGLDFFVPDHDDEHGFHHDCSDENLVHIGIVSLVAIVLHNIIEGMAVYSLASESIKTGFLVALGVGLHNIPMGMIIASTMEHESKKNKIFSYTLACVSTFIGGLIMFFIHSLISEFVIGTLICVTLGMILYIVLFELVPHIFHSDNKKVSVLGFILGIVIILISTLFE